MIVGSSSTFGDSAQPPALLNPQEDNRRRVSAIQSVSVGSNAFQL